ncbi:MAG: hypothetical protein JOY72_07170, partial [Actinobacteria bacterium]|nr:hypothetical protein [Actinomycetota bacterium]
MLSLGSAISGGSGSGTYLSINAANGYAGDLVNLEVNNSSVFRIGSNGVIATASVNSGSMTTGAKTHVATFTVGSVGATTDFAEQPFFVAPAAVTVQKVTFTTTADVTASDTDNQTLTVARRATGTPATADTVEAYTTNTTSGGMTAWVAKSFTSLSNTSLSTGDVLTFKTAHAGNGVALNGLLVTIEYTTTT